MAMVAGMRLFGGGDPAPPPVRVDGGVTEKAAETDAELYVHVAGAVRRPGLVRLPPGTRVAAALERVGGPTARADLTVVNLAAQVHDGQQIVVPVAGRVAGGGAPAAAGAKIHLSTATTEQLDEVDGIGPTLAGRIIEYRDAHGGFRSLQELSEVEGIGEKRLATLREALQP